MPQPIIMRDLSGISEGISAAGSALGDALGKRKERKDIEKTNKKHGSILESTIGKLDKDATPMQFSQALISAVNQGVPKDTAQNFGSLYSALKKTEQNGSPGVAEIDEMSNLFVKFGMDKDSASRNAELWGKLTTGGQTEFAKLLVDKISRNQFSQDNGQVDIAGALTQNENGVTEEVIEKESFKFPEIDIFEDRTPKERANLKSDLLKSNNVELKEINKNYKTSKGNLMRYEQLERLNDSKKLPEGLENANINWNTGEIRYPKLANSETQQYVKTVMDFMSTAKDTFGARVTNFEVGLFLKRLPTLANTEAGRRVILKQMMAIEKLNELHSKSIRDVYDHYGSQRIDRSTAERIAEDYRKEEEESLLKDFANSMQAQEVYEAKGLAPEGKVPARGSDGKIVYIWSHQADKAEKQGYSIL